MALLSQKCPNLDHKLCACPNYKRSWVLLSLHNNPFICLLYSSDSRCKDLSFVLSEPPFLHEWFLGCLFLFLIVKEGIDIYLINFFYYEKVQIQQIERIEKGTPFGFYLNQDKVHTLHLVDKFESFEFISSLTLIFI